MRLQVRLNMLARPREHGMATTPISQVRCSASNMNDDEIEDASPRKRARSAPQKTFAQNDWALKRLKKRDTP